MFVHYLALIIGCIHGSRGDVQAMLGSDVDIPCHDQEVTAVSHWVLTDNTTLDADSSNSNPAVIEDGKTLRITSLAYAHVGKYYCVADGGENGIMLSLITDTGMSAYRTQLTVGLSAAAGVFCVLVLIILVHHFRWRPSEHDKESLHENATIAEDTNGLYNINSDSHNSNRVYPVDRIASGLDNPVYETEAKSYPESNTKL